MTYFFNRFFFCINVGSLMAVTVLVYMQDDVGRKWGYGLCAFSIVLALSIFLAGTNRYRFKKLIGSPMTQVAAVIVAAWRNRRLELPSDPSYLYDLDDIIAAENSMKSKQKLPHTKQFRYYFYCLIGCFIFINLKHFTQRNKSHLYLRLWFIKAKIFLRFKFDIFYILLKGFISNYWVWWVNWMW